ncbi:hypothetical protein KIPB_012789, partial [Kipferlia bialata]
VSEILALLASALPEVSGHGTRPVLDVSPLADRMFSDDQQDPHEVFLALHGIISSASELMVEGHTTPYTVDVASHCVCMRCGAEGAIRSHPSPCISLSPATLSRPRDRLSRPRGWYAHLTSNVL